MGKMYKLYVTAVQGFKALYAGAGYVAPPQPGNTANAPANPSLQTGNYEYIIPQMWPNRRITDIPVIPPFGRDWAAYPVNTYGLSGLEGGGSTGQVPNVNQGATFYFDPDTGQYIDLSLMQGVAVQ